MRLFLAINLPEHVRRAIHDSTAPLRDAAPWVSWTDPSRLHLTLKFLGEQPEESLTGLTSLLPRVTSRHSALTLELGGIGAFPRFRSPRVVWMGVGASPRLELLHHDVEEGCAALGFELEGRAFRPHLTLGRVRGQAEGIAARTLARAARAVSFATEVEIDSVELMLSEPGQGGPRYTALASAPLRRAGS